MIKTVYIISTCLLISLLLSSCKTQDKIASNTLPTIQNGELRIFNIESAIDATAFMYEKYGNWDSKQSGKYQDNIDQYIWSNIDLQNDGKSYTVVTDGTESMSDYFVSVIVRDQKGNLCLDNTHPEGLNLGVYLKNEIENFKAKGKTFNFLKSH